MNKELKIKELLNGDLKIKLTNETMSESFKLGYLKQYLLNEENEVIEYGTDKVEDIKIDVILGKENEFETWISNDFNNKIEFYKNYNLYCHKNTYDENTSIESNINNLPYTIQEKMLIKIFIKNLNKSNEK